ncbi:MAG: WbuC family cupin fold metalloprotein [Cyanobium sp.]
MPSALLKRLDQQLFTRIAGEARSLPRLRRNHNLHQPSDPVQRFLNAMQPGTYVRPHRHRRSRPGAGFECFVVLQGAIGLLLLDDSGAVVQHECLSAAGPLRGIELAEGVLHTLVALEPDSLLLEIKEGPYEPAADKDFLAAFPEEGCEAARRQEQAWRDLFGGAGASGSP